MATERDEIRNLAREVRCLRWAVVTLVLVAVLVFADKLAPLLAIWFVFLVPAAYFAMHFILEWFSPTKAHDNDSSH